MYFNTIKKKPTAKLILNGEKPEILLKSGQGKDVPSHSFQHCSRSPG